jgi:uncharacterized protein (TIGR00297 family)
MTPGEALIGVLLAIAANAGAGYAAWRRGSVTGLGAIAGGFVGAVILIAGGLVHWIMLMLFFVSSSLVSRLGPHRKNELERMHEKGSRRDAVQVFANGGIATVAVVLLRITGEAVFGLAAAAAFASVNADTWASELGVLSPHRPRSIVTWRPLEPGTSGGVSLLGTAASSGGSVLIASWYAIASALGLHPLLTPPSSIGMNAAGVFLLVALAGILGTTADSVLGATLQAQYRDADGSLTERRVGAGGPNRRARGVAIVTNDVVNLVSSAVAAAGASLVYLLAV